MNMLTEIIYGKHIQGEVVDFEMMECGGCGIPFFVPTKWKNNKIQANGKFSCPNGCNRIFIAKTEVEKVQEELAQLKAESERQKQILQDRWLDEMNAKNKLAKQLKRIHKGVCPCCNRSFMNLKRHMETKHPTVQVSDTTKTP